MIVDITTIVAVVTPPDAVTVTVEPDDSMVHCVGSPDDPTVIVGKVALLEVPFRNRLEFGSK